MGSTIEHVDDIVREKMSSLNGTAHSYAHVKRVFNIAVLLATKEGANLELVKIGSLMHDLGRVIGSPHNETGAKLTREILKEMKYPSENSEKIAKIVLNHEIGAMPESLEEMIVWDADKLDLLGAVGIARVFHWAGATKETFEKAVKYCFENMEPICDSMKTQTAKKMAEHEYEIVKIFLFALEKELSSSLESLE